MKTWKDNPKKNKEARRKRPVYMVGGLTGSKVHAIHVLRKHPKQPTIKVQIHQGHNVNPTSFLKRFA